MSSENSTASDVQTEKKPVVKIPAKANKSANQITAERAAKTKPVAKDAKRGGVRKPRVEIFGAGACDVIRSLAEHYGLTPMQIIAGAAKAKLPVAEGTIRIQATPAKRKGCEKVTGAAITEFVKMAKAL